MDIGDVRARAALDQKLHHVEVSGVSGLVQRSRVRVRSLRVVAIGIAQVIAQPVDVAVIEQIDGAAKLGVRDPLVVGAVERAQLCSGHVNRQARPAGKAVLAGDRQVRVAQGGFLEIWGSPAPSRIFGRARDVEVRDRLWQISEELTGVQVAAAAA
jgi:hypothetical protein